MAMTVRELLDRKGIAARRAGDTATIMLDDDGVEWALLCLDYARETGWAPSVFNLETGESLGFGSNLPAWPVWTWAGIYARENILTGERDYLSSREEVFADIATAKRRMAERAAEDDEDDEDWLDDSSDDDIEVVPADGLSLLGIHKVSGTQGHDPQTGKTGF